MKRNFFECSLVDKLYNCSFCTVTPFTYIVYIRLAVFCCQALGVCSHSDRSALKKKLKEMKKREEKEERGREKRLKEEKEKEKNSFLNKESEESEQMMTEERSGVEARRSGRTGRTESLL